MSKSKRLSLASLKHGKLHAILEKQRSFQTGRVVMTNLSIYDKLIKAQAQAAKGKTNTKFSENGLELSIDDNGFMTAKTVDIMTRMAGKTTAEKMENLDHTLATVAKSLHP